MKVACVQFSPRHGRVQQNRERMAALWPADAQLVVFPELATTGYLHTSTQTLLPLAEQPNGPTAQFICEQCKKTGSLAVYGFAEREGERIYNSSALVGPDGLIGVYRKVHLFANEANLFSPGEREWPVFEVNGVRLGMMICFDWIVPEAARVLALKGADILCHPSNLVLTYCQDAMRTRCLENAVFALTCNRIGSESVGRDTLTFTGQSQIVSPLGERLAQAAQAEEEVICVEIDPERSRNKFITETNHLFEQRRPELYRKLYETKT